MVKVLAGEIVGLEAIPVEVEVGILSGLHSFTIVGLADKAINEAKERISLAIKSIGAKPPLHFSKKIIVNLAPADLKKEGTIYDLSIALGFLKASKQINAFLEDKLFIGELSLKGEVRKIKGALCYVLMAKKLNIKEVYIPKDNEKEVKFIDGIDIYPVKNLKELIEHLEGKFKIEKLIPQKLEIIWDEDKIFSYLKGLEFFKKIIQIVAAGGHHVLFFGSPGTGKSLLAQAINDLLPPLDFEDAIETTLIHSIYGDIDEVLFKPPFRSPHHSSSEVAILGGGQKVKAGEITLAHNGILFLDELPEFSRKVIEGLREPLENGEIVISRAKEKIKFPAKFTLVGAMNPCPCGWYGDSEKECKCTVSEIRRYQKKISGPLLDRFDIFVNVPRIEPEKILESNKRESIFEIREKIKKAREIQIQRQGKLNRDLNFKEIEKFININKEMKEFLKLAAERLKLSPRAIHKILKISRTLADFEQKENIELSHIQEAIQYRQSEFFES
jgi:magnesium chelatase family protein